MIDSRQAGSDHPTTQSFVTGFSLLGVQFLLLRVAFNPSAREIGNRVRRMGINLCRAFSALNDKVQQRTKDTREAGKPELLVVLFFRPGASMIRTTAQRVSSNTRTMGGNIGTRLRPIRTSRAHTSFRPRSGPGATVSC